MPTSEYKPLPCSRSEFVSRETIGKEIKVSNVMLLIVLTINYDFIFHQWNIFSDGVFSSIDCRGVQFSRMEEE